MRTVGLTQVASLGCAFACALGVVAGCSSAYSQLPGLETVNAVSGTPAANCHNTLSIVRHAVDEAKSGDAESRRIEGFTYLRINRFLAHVGHRFRGSSSGPAFDAWVDRLRTLDAAAVRIEIANLPAANKFQLSHRLFGKNTSRDRVAEVAHACAEKLRTIDLANPIRRQQLVGAAHVADNYSEVARTVGLYPVASIPISAGWNQWKKDNLPTFEKPVAALPVNGSLRDYTPSSASGPLKPAQVQAIVARSRDAHLDIPDPKGRDRARLFQTFAPIWQVDVADSYDEIGHPEWQDAGSVIGIDTARPTVFTRISHTVVGGKILLQLNYAVWFAGRPSSGPLDGLAGRLDGVIWRVTLGEDGRPLIYDSVHACGCYHLLFPLASFNVKHRSGGAPDLREVPAILDTSLKPSTNMRVVLRIASASHYVVAVSQRRSKPSQLPARPYRFSHDASLQSLKLNKAERRSLFGETGLVSGTGRLERFVLWPTGIDSPGAMRQWGHHATAFVGRRHFDDPLLFKTIFSP